MDEKNFISTLFRKEYSNKCQESLASFLGKSVKLKNVEQSELLLTVGIPVYNVEEYVGSSIQSVIDSIGDNTEIIIVDDGSTDNSKEVIMEYQKKYPDLIRRKCF